jgi:hypothetical protein
MELHHELRVPRDAARRVPGAPSIRRRSHVSVDLPSVWWVGALCVLLAGSIAFDGALSVAQAQAAAPRAVVVAELFTSEGCSSCPRADEVLSQLVLRQPVRGVEVLALGEHVDYWDRLGWRDRFSSALFSNRQSSYDDRVFHTSQVYTPQLVVDGHLERVGSDAAAVQLAIAQAGRAPKAVVGVTVVRSADGRDLLVNVHAEMPPALATRDRIDVLVAVTEDNLVTDVRRGENRGRTLEHSAVVRSLTTAAVLSPREPASSTRASVSWVDGWKPADVRVIALLQERQSRHIVGAGSTRLDGSVGMK